jgi:GT2 family glycosyltransferase
MSVSRSPLFAFLDTDCQPFPDWLEKVLQPFTGQNVGAVGGAEEVHVEDSTLMKAIHFCMTSTFTTGGMRGKKGKKLARYYPRTFNMAVSREAFKKTGGFKPLYHGEDVEFSFRIKEAGFELCYADDAKVYHRRRSTLQQYFFQVLNMGEARITLTRLHPSLLEPLHVMPAAGIGVVVFLCLLSFFSTVSLVVTAALLIVGTIFLCLIGYTAFRITASLRLMFLAPVIFAVQQLAYALGFFRGALKWLSGKSS